jgi:hypothetical protein
LIEEVGRVDVVLLADVLEHVAAPHGLLVKSPEALRPGGSVIVSVPNIAHWSIRANLCVVISIIKSPESWMRRTCGGSPEKLCFPSSGALASKSRITVAPLVSGFPTSRFGGCQLGLDRDFSVLLRCDGRHCYIVRVPTRSKGRNEMSSIAWEPSDRRAVLKPSESKDRIQREQFRWYIHAMNLFRGLKPEGFDGF